MMQIVRVCVYGGEASLHKTKPKLSWNHNSKHWQVIDKAEVTTDTDTK